MTADIQPRGAGLGRGHLPSIALIAVFDIAGPLVAYSLLRPAGLSAVSALVLSGIFPVLGVATGFIRRRRVDPLGVLVLLGIAVGSVLGLVTGDPAWTTVLAVRTRTAVPRPDGRGPVCQRPAGVLL